MLPRELAEAVAVRLPASEEVYGAVLPSLKHLRADENGELAPDFPGPHMRPTAPPPAHLGSTGAEPRISQQLSLGPGPGRLMIFRGGGTDQMPPGPEMPPQGGTGVDWGAVEKNRLPDPLFCLTV